MQLFVHLFAINPAKHFIGSANRCWKQSHEKLLDEMPSSETLIYEIS